MHTKIEEDYTEFLAWYEFMLGGNDEEAFWENFDASVEEVEQRGW